MRFVETVMGIPMSIDVRDAVDRTIVEAAAERAFGVLREADRRFSRYRPDSELSRINAAGGDLGAASGELREAVALGSAMAEASGGAFRVRTPDGEWDLDGVVKGWAADRAASELAAAGLRDYCLNAGGDVAISGSPGGGRPWNVAIRSPLSADATLAVLAIGGWGHAGSGEACSEQTGGGHAAGAPAARGRADTEQTARRASGNAARAGVATSGAYERGDHIVDGRSGAPAAGLTSATVVADDLTTADLLATAVFALGADGVPWAIANGARGVLVVAAGGGLLGAGELPFANSVRDAVRGAR